MLSNEFTNNQDTSAPAVISGDARKLRFLTKMIHKLNSPKTYETNSPTHALNMSLQYDRQKDLFISALFDT